MQSWWFGTRAQRRKLQFVHDGSYELVVEIKFLRVKLVRCYNLMVP